MSHVLLGGLAWLQSTASLPRARLAGLAAGLAVSCRHVHSQQTWQRCCCIMVPTCSAGPWLARLRLLEAAAARGGLLGSCLIVKLAHWRASRSSGLSLFTHQERGA